MANFTVLLSWIEAQGPYPSVGNVECIWNVCQNQTNGNYTKVDFEQLPINLISSDIPAEDTPLKKRKHIFQLLKSAC